MAAAADARAARGVWRRHPPARWRRVAASPWLHASALAALSAAWEALFVRHGLNAVDEGWPLYAAMRLREGGVLYRDAFFVFPPGHLLPAWLGTWWEPGGVVATRVLYAGFAVGLCVALYFLGRRFMPPAAAFLGAALLAVAAPDSHGAQYLFGYRYLVLSALAMLCFAERLRRGERRFLCAAGALVGLQLVFRLTPAIAVAVGLVVGIAAAQRRLRGVLADGAWLAAGFACVTAPVLVWLAVAVGLDAVWREVVVRPVRMTDLQSLPVPPLYLPTEWNRWVIRSAFVTIQFRLFALLYLALGVGLAARLLRAWRAGRPFGEPLLLAVVVWGGVFYLRSFGRADEAHLDSAVPVALLLLAFAVSLPLRGAFAAGGLPGLGARAALLGFFAGWVFLTAPDLYLSSAVRGTRPVESLAGSTSILASHRIRVFDPTTGGMRVRSTEHRFAAFDELVQEIRRWTPADGVWLDLSASSLLHVVSGRSGPGGADVVMPGTFLSAAEERSFIERLERRPPALVIVYRKPFDDLPSRALPIWAPQLAEWVRERYERHRRIGDFLLLLPRRTADPEAGTVTTTPPDRPLRSPPRRG